MHTGIGFFMVIIEYGAHLKAKVGAGEKLFDQGSSGRSGSIDRQPFLFSIVRYFLRESLPKNSK